MEGRVPGGRKSSTIGDGFSTEEEDETTPNTKLRHTSHSLPRIASDATKSDYIAEDSNKSHTLDRRKKFSSSSFRSFGGFVRKIVRQMSQVSVQSPSPRITKRRSRSSGRSPHRSKGVNEADFSVGPPIQFDKSKPPGVVGIRNHGNTCFMNAVLQCLSHTELLVEYFITNQYKNDIKRNNKHSNRKYGTKGELTEHLVQLLKSLWTCKYSSEISNEFKSVVGKHGSQYRGYSQHDAQEFLLWLLDKVHEDLNISTKKKYRANKSSVGRSDEAVAAEALANHMRCNNSFIYDLFQALYRSSLTCPQCRRQSNTFDPFLSVSLPIPQKTKRPVYVTVVYLDAQPKQVRIGLLMNQCDTVKTLRHTLASDTKIPVDQLILTEIYQDGFHRTFHDSQALSDIHESDNIYAVEVPLPETEEIETSSSPQVKGASSSPNNSAPSSHNECQFITVVVLNKQITGSQNGKRFGGPIVMQVSRDTSYLDLQNVILNNIMAMLRESIIAQKMGVLFRLRVVDGLSGRCYLSSDVDMPLYTSSVERALSNCVPGGGPQHLKLIVEWDQQTKHCMIGSCEEQIEEHASVKQVKLAHEQPVLGTLDECFQLYTQEEKLGTDDAWYCPNCRRRQTGTVKSLSLWSLPDVLVIHLKRFKQIGLRRTKLNTLITFPTRDLDMSQHITKKTQQQGYKATTGWSPWRPYRRAPNCPEDYVYDLYAVCNHYGNMQGGHYTAFCKNVATKKWYNFDDTKVTELDPNDVVTEAAYLLFYQRRAAHTNKVSHPTHWIRSLANVTVSKPPPVSKSHEDLLDDPPAADTKSVDSMFNRSVQAYATLRTPLHNTQSTDALPQVHTTTTTTSPADSPGMLAHKGHNQSFTSLRSMQITPTKTDTLLRRKLELRSPTEDYIKSVNGIVSPSSESQRSFPSSSSESRKRHQSGTDSSISAPSGVMRRARSMSKTRTGSLDRETQTGTFDYSKTVYLQESCV